MEDKPPKTPAQLDDALASMVAIKDSVWEKKLEVAIKNMDSVLKKKKNPKDVNTKVIPTKTPSFMKNHPKPDEAVINDDKVVIKDSVKNYSVKNKHKDSTPKVPKVPKKKNPKVIIKDSKVPKNRPPRSQGSGYYSSYYVGDRRSGGGRVRVWVWVWA